MRATGTIGWRELARRMAVAGGWSVPRAEELARGICGVVRGAVAGGAVVRISGFGRMEMRAGYRRVRNPKTGKCGRVGRRRFFFRPSKSLLGGRG